MLLLIVAWPDESNDGGLPSGGGPKSFDDLHKLIGVVLPIPLASW